MAHNPALESVRQLAVGKDKQVCTQCYQPKLHKFFTKEEGGATFVCNECCEKNKQRFIEEEVKEKSADSVNQIVKSVTGTLIDRRDAAMPSITDIGTEIIKRFGGVEDFTQEWFNQIQCAMVEKPGSKTALDAFKQVAGIISECSKIQNNGDELKEMTDEELQEYINREARNQLDSLRIHVATEAS